jgi:hypothetical protein
MPCAPVTSPRTTRADPWAPAADVASSLVFDDLEDDFSVGPRRRRIENGTDRLRRPTLLSDDPPDVFLGHFQLEDRRGVALCLLDVDRFRVIHELLGYEQDEFLHGSHRSFFEGGL